MKKQNCVNLSPRSPLRSRSPRSPLRSGSPRSPLRSGSPRSPLRSGSPRIPLRSGSPRIPLRSRSPRSPLRSGSPRSPLRSGSPRIPLRSGSPRSPLRSGSPRSPLRSGSPRIPLRSGSPRSPLRSGSPRSPLRSGSPRNPLRSGSPRNPLRSGSPRSLLRSGSPRIPLRSGSPLRSGNPQSPLQGQPHPGTRVCLFLHALFRFTGLARHPGLPLFHLPPEPCFIFVCVCNVWKPFLRRGFLSWVRVLQLSHSLQEVTILPSSPTHYPDSIHLSLINKPSAVPYDHRLHVLLTHHFARLFPHLPDCLFPHLSSLCLLPRVGTSHYISLKSAWNPALLAPWIFPVYAYRDFGFPLRGGLICVYFLLY